MSDTQNEQALNHATINEAMLNYEYESDPETRTAFQFALLTMLASIAHSLVDMAANTTPTEVKLMPKNLPPLDVAWGTWSAEDIQAVSAALEGVD